MRLAQQTKVIWSLDGDLLNQQSTVDLIKHHDIKALRIAYNSSYEKDIINFVATIKKELLGSSDEAIPVIIDVGSMARAKIVDLGKRTETSYEQKLTIVPRGKTGDIKIESSIPFDKLFIEKAQLFFGSGLVVMQVERIHPERIDVIVQQGGILEDGMDLAVPSTRKAPSLFDFSSIDLPAFAKLGVDFVVLPGVSNTRELAIVRKKLESAVKDCPWVIVKIDDRSMVDNLEGLLEHVDGVLISRRDLAMEMDPASVPVLCKEISRLCSEKAKLVFIESDMLASMRHNPTPTRAEVSDIANAVLDGTDAVVLSEEISKGGYAQRALQICTSIVSDVERNDEGLNWVRQDLPIADVLDAVSYHAYKTAERVRAKAIVCVTKQGNTALRLASFKTKIPIIAVTFSEKTKKRLSLVRGVYALSLDIAPNLDEVLPVVNEHLKKESWLSVGDKIVFVTVSLSSMGFEASNLFTVQSLF